MTWCLLINDSLEFWELKLCKSDSGSWAVWLCPEFCHSVENCDFFFVLCDSTSPRLTCFSSALNAQNRAVGKSPFTPQLFSLFSHSCSFPSASKNNSVMIHQPHFLQVIIFPRWVTVYSGGRRKNVDWIFFPCWHRTNLKYFVSISTVISKSKVKSILICETETPEVHVISRERECDEPNACFV